jgi:hypothetical protein
MLSQTNIRHPEENREDDNIIAERDLTPLVPLSPAIGGMEREIRGRG